MEKELKTLKDLKESSCKIASVDNPTIYGFSEVLKQEAIKWIKPNDKHVFWEWMRKEKGTDYMNESLAPIQFIKYFIEYFFNITEEDLNGSA